MVTKKQSRNYYYSLFLRSSEHKNQSKTSDHSQDHMYFVEIREVTATQPTEEMYALQTPQCYWTRLRFPQAFSKDMVLPG